MNKLIYKLNYFIDKQIDQINEFINLLNELVVSTYAVMVSLLHIVVIGGLLFFLNRKILYKIKELTMIGLLLFTYPLFAASFDCAKSKTVTEKTICSDVLISLQDEIMTDSYLSSLKKNDASYQKTIRSSHKKWLKDNRNICGGDVNCLIDSYNYEISYLKGLESIGYIDDLVQKKGWKLVNKMMEDEEFEHYFNVYNKNNILIKIKFYYRSMGFVEIKYFN